MTQYIVNGMSCAACVNRVEKAVSKVDGVSSCAVNLLTNTLTVEGDVLPNKIVEAVQKAGYDAKISQKDTVTQQDSPSSNQNHDEFDSLQDTETPKLKKRLFTSLGFLLLLMYVSMGHTMFDFPLPPFFEGNFIATSLAQLLLSSIVMIINQKFFISGTKSLLHKAPNMDTLVALGSACAFVYSTINLFLMTDASLKGDTDTISKLSHEFYFESSAMILTLITVGKMLEARSKGKTTDALKSLIKLTPKTATVIRDGREHIVHVYEVNIDDIFIVRPGEKIAVDGIIIEGNSTIDESSLTGESIPIDKNQNSSVFAGTINLTGFIKCKATKVGSDTTLSQIIKLVETAGNTKAPVAKIADKVSGIFVPSVILISLITIIIHFILGMSQGVSTSQALGNALIRGIAVLVISCPCSLGLATPVAIMVANGVGAKNGILFKTAVSLENTGKAKIVALDKTGTITKGKPVVTDIIPFNQFTQNELLTLASSIEKKSEHPLAKAIIQKAEELHIETFEVTDFEALSGMGVRAVFDEKEIFGGSYKFMSEKLANKPSLTNINHTDITTLIDKLSSEGKTPLLFSMDDAFYGIIAVSDTLKDDSQKAIKELKELGLKVVMLTGDNQTTANAIGKTAGVDQIISDVLPNQKDDVIKELQKNANVIMVGDGINDAIALTRSDTGIAIGAGSDVAIDAADIVLMKNSLLDVAAAIRLSRSTLKNIHQNLFWAFFYNALGIPLAAGCFSSVFGWQLNPMLAALAMSLSSFCVVSNALRLNFCKLYKKETKIKNINSTKKENTLMKKTLKIKGMMCPHCENHVKTALENLNGITVEKVSHTASLALVTLTNEVTDDELKNAVTQAGYEVTEIL